MSRVPFKLDVAEGFVTVRGVAYLDGDALVVETRRAVLDLVPLGSETLRLPVGEIESIHLEAGLMTGRLVVRPFDGADLAGFPGDPDVELALPVARKHRAAAEALARATRLRTL